MLICYKKTGHRGLNKMIFEISVYEVVREILKSQVMR